MTASDAARSFSGIGPLHGHVRVPGDKSISHRALLFGALAEGTSYVTGLGDGDDIVRTRIALTNLGIEFTGNVIEGGRSRLHEAERPVDMGNSGTGMRLLTGVCASLPFLTILIGDESIHRRPMDRIAVPLREMGARIDGRDRGRLAPLVVRGGDLTGIDYSPPMASAQVKGSILLAGLGASGETRIREPIPTRRHTEEMMAMAGADVRTEMTDDGYVVRLYGSELHPFELDVPGDPSQAAFLVVAACIVPGSEITVENVYVGPGRAGFLNVLERMGADIELVETSATSADIVVRSAPLHGTEIGGREIPDLIDEIPVLAVAAACAEGQTIVRDAAELRVKESDRIDTVTSELGSLGARIEARPDGFVIEGGGLAPSGTVTSHGDHRVAMSLAIAALVGEDEVQVTGFDAVATSWPSFVADLQGLAWR